jgi:hypothetical protein
MGRALSGLLLSALLTTLACGSAETQWTAVDPGDGSFRAELPGKPKRVSNSIETPAGPAPIEMWMVEDGERAFMVGFTEYPERVRAVVEDSELLDSARDGAVARVRGRLLIDEPKQAGGASGRRIEFDAEGGQVRVRGDLFVSGRRLYQAFATVSPTEVDSADVLRFLDSFRILPRVAREGEMVLEGAGAVPRAADPDPGEGGR